MEKPLFSVCMVTYNQVDYIKNTIESVLHQKHSYTYELLISDDSSTDGTQRIIEKYAQKYPKIIKANYNKKNIGAMNNYFHTLNRCHGKYILFCDGDDVWLPGKVVKQISFMENNKDFGFCYSKMKIVKHNSGIMGYNPSTILDVFHTNPVPSSTLCFKTSLWTSYFKNEKPVKQKWMIEDYPFVLFCFLNSNGFFFNEILAEYNEIQNSLSHPQNIKKKFLYQKCIEDVKKYFINKYKYAALIKTDKQILQDLSQGLLDSFDTDVASDLMDLNYEFGINDKIVTKLCKSVLSNSFYRLLRLFKKIIKNLLPYGIVSKFINR